MHGLIDLMAFWHGVGYAFLVNDFVWPHRLTFTLNMSYLNCPRRWVTM